MYLISISLLLGFFYGSAIFFWCGGYIEEAKIALEFTTSISVVAALATYFYKKNQDVTAAAIDQISLFRKEIIPMSWDFIERINSIKNLNNETLPRAIIDIEDLTLNSLRIKYKDAIEFQLRLLDEHELRRKQNELLNTLEEVAIKIIHFKTQKNKALNSIKATFVQIVEENAAVISLYREVDKSFYSVTLEIYNLWKDGVDREPLTEKARKAFK